MLDVLHAIQEWFSRVDDWIDGQPATVLRVYETVAIILTVAALRFVALRVVRRHVDDIKRAYHLRRLVNHAAGIVLVVALVVTWFTGLKEVGTFLGLLSAGLAIALSDPLSNLAGWIFILARRPFVVGDRISLGGHTGDVIDIRLFQTFLLECGEWVDADQSTGRIILIPNNKIFRHMLASYTRGFEYIWDEVYVLVTFESDWRRAKEIVTEIANTHAQPLSKGAQEQIRAAASKHMIFFRNLTPIVYTDVKSSGVQLAIRYLTHPRKRRSSRHRIWEAILEAFETERAIDFAYPTTRHYQNQLEGKPGARASAPAS